MINLGLFNLCKDAPLHEYMEIFTFMHEGRHESWARQTDNAPWGGAEGTERDYPGGGGVVQAESQFS